MVVCMMTAIVPVSAVTSYAAGGNPIEYYQYYNEDEQRFEKCEVPDFAMRFSQLGNDITELGIYQVYTWYILDCDYENTIASIRIKGNVRLLLMDGCELKVHAIRVDYPNSICIYAQENGTGTIIADNGGHYYGYDPGCAGIGGSGFGVEDSIYNFNSGAISIYGGKITAIGGPKAAGIGGSGRTDENACAGNITIRGGEITAIGGTGNSGGTGAGIGGGASGNATNITISGGKVHARSVQLISQEASAAIGCGGDDFDGGCFENITISGGEITAESSGYGAAIGGGYKTTRGARNITITGGHITANADVGRMGDEDECSAAIGAGYKSSGINISISGENTEITAIGAGDTAIGNPDKNANITIDSALECLAGSSINDLTDHSADPVNAVKTNKAAKLHKVIPVIAYSDENGISRTHKGYLMLDQWSTADQVCNWNSQMNPTNWYVIGGPLYISDTVYVSGDITLVIKDDCELNMDRGLQIQEGSSLTVYMQSAQSGAFNCDYINTDGNTVVIKENGKLTLNGGQLSIRSPFGHAFEVDHGQLIINEGNITAKSSEVVLLSDGGTVTVSKVFACFAGKGTDKLTFSFDSVNALRTNTSARLLSSNLGNPGIEIPEKAATCVIPGHRAFYMYHGKYYSDKDCTREITDIDNWLKTDGATVGEHTYSEKWTYDENTHWHAATCAHTTLRSDEGTHTPDNNGFCSVCGKPTVKAFSGKAATCEKDGHRAYYKYGGKCYWDKECTKEIKDLDYWLEADGRIDGGHKPDESGICTVCGKSVIYEIPGWAATCESTGRRAYYRFGIKDYEDKKCTKEIKDLDNWLKTDGFIPMTDHTYSRKWSYDENSHWHAATCPHKDLRADEAAHTPNSSGYCTVCGKMFVIEVPGRAATCEVSGRRSYYRVGTQNYEDKECTKRITDLKNWQKTSGYIPVLDHTYSDEWTYDENTHWHAATCEHKNRRGDEAAHIPDDNGFCKVCGSPGLVEYPGEAATCEEAGHLAYYKFGGKCYQDKECTKEIKDLDNWLKTDGFIPMTDHTYSKNWTSDENSHWHAATCPHKDLRADEAAHTQDNRGYCTVCGYHAKNQSGAGTFFSGGNWWIIAVGAAVIGGGVAAFLIIVKKKKKSATSVGKEKT